MTFPSETYTARYAYVQYFVQDTFVIPDFRETEFLSNTAIQLLTLGKHTHTRLRFVC